MNRSRNQSELGALRFVPAQAGGMRNDVFPNARKRQWDKPLACPRAMRSAQPSSSTFSQLRRHAQHERQT